MLIHFNCCPYNTYDSKKTVIQRPVVLLVAQANQWLSMAFTLTVGFNEVYQSNWIIISLLRLIRSYQTAALSILMIILQVIHKNVLMSV